MVPDPHGSLLKLPPVFRSEFDKWIPFHALKFLMKQHMFFIASKSLQIYFHLIKLANSFRFMMNTLFCYLTGYDDVKVCGTQ